MGDRLHIALSSDQAVRFRVAEADELARELVRRHQPSPLAAEALVRGATAALLYPLSWKSYERVSIQWSGQGPLGGLVAEMRAGPRIRAYPNDPAAAFRAEQPFSGRRGIGFGLLPRGQLNVLRQEPSGAFDRGQTGLRSGEVDEDLEGYLVQGEQVPTRLRVLTRLGADGRPEASLGVLAQLMPEAPLERLPSAGDLEALGPGAPLHEVLSRVAGGSYEVLETQDPSFACTCSRERLAAAISMLEVDELLDMINEDQGARSRCDFCAEQYAFDREALETILVDKVTSKPDRGAGSTGPGSAR